MMSSSVWLILISTMFGWLLITGLTICGANCLLSADYKSASKIIARTGQAQPRKGDVIVTTRSGGEGSCTVQFKSVMVVPGMIHTGLGHLACEL